MYWVAGAVIGRGGDVINQMKTVVGVKIRISERDDFLPGTRNRKITISGPAENVHIAHTLILQKINQG
jgi:RNA-binding protein Nova